jgi:hypothetical protein
MIEAGAPYTKRVASLLSMVPWCARPTGGSHGRAKRRPHCRMGEGARPESQHQSFDAAGELPAVVGKPGIYRRSRNYRKRAGGGKPRLGWCESPAGTEGGKPRPDYVLPNLAPWPLNVVNLHCSVFKAHPDAPCVRGPRRLPRLSPARRRSQVGLSQKDTARIEAD